jgi:DNA-directed RNA polymerase specialized sigma24 family protein
VVSSKRHFSIAWKESLEERGEVCLAEEVERLRLLGFSDGEIASKMGVDASWVETVISSGEDEPGPESAD